MACDDYPANERDRRKQEFVIQDGQSIILFAHGLNSEADMLIPEYVIQDEAYVDYVWNY